MHQLANIRGCFQAKEHIGRTDLGDSSVFVLSRTGHFGYSSIHNSVNIIGRTFMLHLHGSCHICVSMCDQHFFVNNFNWLIYP